MSAHAEAKEMMGAFLSCFPDLFLSQGLLPNQEFTISATLDV